MRLTEKTSNKIKNILKNVSVEELKKVAIAYKDKIEMEEILIASEVNSMLIEKMASGEFSKFAEKELW